MIFQLILNVICTISSKNQKQQNAKYAKDDLFVSIHVPIHNEPSRVVIKSLECLAKIDYHNFEVIVLDNNTSDENLYLPVKAFCERRNKCFKFYHYDNVLGYKAGALNICHELSSPLAQIYLIVDADYNVYPDIIRKGLAYFNSEKISAVQFPQSYRDKSLSNLSIIMNYAYYFDIILNKANEMKCALPTGTLTLVKKSAINKLGGWPINSLTEDAQLGINLYKENFQINFVREISGTGLAPSTFEVLRKQRFRWLYGNMQVFVKFLINPFAYKITFILGIFMQLTAWINFTGLPLLILLLSPIYNVKFSNSHVFFLQLLCIISLNIHIIIKLLIFCVYSIKSNMFNWKNAIGAWLIHISLMYDGAFGWWKLFFNINIPFIVTEKSTVVSTNRSYRILIIPIVLMVNAFNIWDYYPNVSIMVFIVAMIFLISPIVFNRKSKQTKIMQVIASGSPLKLYLKRIDMQMRRILK